MGHPLDVVVFGKGDIAIATCAWLASSRAHRLRAVVPVIPEPTWTGSLMTWADEHSVDIVPSGRWQDLEQGLKIDLGISIFCHQIFPQRFIERCGRLVNLHNSLLPKYRGMAPINWALNNGEREHGLTLHEITSDIDAGPIIDQQAYPISPAEDEVIDVYRRALLVGWTLMERNLPTLHQSPAKPQDEDQATYYSAADQARLGPRRYFRRNEHAPRD